MLLAPIGTDFGSLVPPKNLSRAMKLTKSGFSVAADDATMERPVSAHDQMATSKVAYKKSASLFMLAM